MTSETNELIENFYLFLIDKRIANEGHSKSELRKQYLESTRYIHSKSKSKEIKDWKTGEVIGWI